MKKLIFALAFIFLSTSLLLAESKGIEFRMVISNQDAKAKSTEKYSFARKKDDPKTEIFINKDVLLSSGDIQTINIVKKENSIKGSPVLDIVFNPQGASKLRDITANNRQKPMAVLSNNEILSVQYILFPIVCGHSYVMSRKLTTDEEAINFVKKLGYKPQFVMMAGM